MDAPPRVSWCPPSRASGWSPEAAQSTGHAAILREGIDGRGGWGQDELGDEAWWTAYVTSVEAAAVTADLPSR